jgi:hypothetical protein
MSKVAARMVKLVSWGLSCQHSPGFTTAGRLGLSLRRGGGGRGELSGTPLSYLNLEL